MAADRVLRGGTLLDGCGGAPLRDAVVVITGGRIVEVAAAPGPGLPGGVERLDLSPDSWIIPGLVDAHVHVVGPWVERALLDSGVTAVRDPGATDERTHSPALVELRAGPVIDCPPALPRRHGAWVESPAQMAAEVRRQAEHLGVDLVKLYTRLPPELVRAGVTEAHARGLRAMGDLVRTSWTEAAGAGIDFLCHAVPRHPDLLPPARRADYVDAVQNRAANPVQAWLARLDLAAAPVARLADVLAEHGVVVDPTLVALESLLFTGDPEFHQRVAGEQGQPPPELGHAQQVPGLEPATVDRLRRLAAPALDAALGLVELLHRRGVAVIAGSDAPRGWVAPGASLRRELRLLTRAGLSRAEALHAATAGAARALGLHHLGAVAPGKRADLVVLDGDPRADLDHLARVRHVLRGGQPVVP